MTLLAHDIGAVEDFACGRPYRIEVNGKALVVVRRGGQFYALRNICPHQGASLSDGHVGGVALAAKPGEAISYDRVGEILTCPWHGWEFDLCTGRSLISPDRVRVRTYPVRIENDRVLVELG